MDSSRTGFGCSEAERRLSSRRRLVEGAGIDRSSLTPQGRRILNRLAGTHEPTIVGLVELDRVVCRAGHVRQVPKSQPSTGPTLIRRGERWSVAQ